MRKIIEKTERKEKDRRELTSTLTISTLFIFFSVFTLFAIFENKVTTDDKLIAGMNQAELNCLKLICENNECSTIQIITQAQNYCKSLVYGTDFYMRLK